jgi:hypothetical protein
MNKSAHGGAEGEQVGFPATEQARVAGADVWVVTNRDDGGHVEHGARARRLSRGEADTPEDGVPD